MNKGKLVVLVTMIYIFFFALSTRADDIIPQDEFYTIFWGMFITLLVITYYLVNIYEEIKKSNKKDDKNAKLG